MPRLKQFKPSYLSLSLSLHCGHTPERRETMATLVARGTLLYLASVNAGSAALFAYDKRQAHLQRHRVSERRLCQTAAWGGWAGGLLAMHLFRHKTRKQSFQRKYVGALARNAVTVVLPLAAVAMWMPPLRAAFAADFARVFRGPPPPRRWGGGRKPPRMRR